MAQLPKTNAGNQAPDAATATAVRTSKDVLRDAYKALADTQHLVRERGTTPGDTR